MRSVVTWHLHVQRRSRLVSGAGKESPLTQSSWYVFSVGDCSFAEIFIVARGAAGDARIVSLFMKKFDNYSLVTLTTLVLIDAGRRGAERRDHATYHGPSLAGLVFVVTPQTSERSECTS